MAQETNTTKHLIIADVAIKGVCPLYFTKPTKDPNPKTAAQEIEYAKNKVYQDPQGNVFITSRSIKSALKQAIKTQGIKIGRSTRTAGNMITSLLTVNPDNIFFTTPDGKQMTFDDLQLIEIPMSVDASAQSRMKWLKYYVIPNPDWILNFKLRFSDALEPNFVQESLHYAGILCGIGGRRSDGAGRFEVTKFEIDK